MNSRVQKNVLQFDGVDDYIDFGSTVGNDIRTSELWFNPNQNIGSLITDFQTLLARNTGSVGSATDFIEYRLTFMPNFSSETGKIQFFMFVGGLNSYKVSPDSTK